MPDEAASESPVVSRVEEAALESAKMPAEAGVELVSPEPSAEVIEEPSESEAIDESGLGGPELVASGEASALGRELAELRARADELSRALIEREEALAQSEHSYKAALVDRELLSALAGRPLVESATAQLLKLWRDEVETVQEGGELKVRARGGQKVAEAVADWLERPEYAHFSRSLSRGGTARPGSQIQGQGQDQARSALARNLGESVIQQWLQAEASAAGDGSLPVGLHRRRR